MKKGILSTLCFLATGLCLSGMVSASDVIRLQNKQTNDCLRHAGSQEDPWAGGCNNIQANWDSSASGSYGYVSVPNVFNSLLRTSLNSNEVDTTTPGTSNPDCGGEWPDLLFGETCSWKLIPAGGGYFFLRNLSDGKNLKLLSNGDFVLGASTGNRSKWKVLDAH